jgi:hypothetical protein
MPPHDRAPILEHRTRWPDDAIDRLNVRLGTVEETTGGLSRMPERVRDKIDEGHREIRAAQRAHHREVREDLRALEERINDRFDKVDLDHAHAPQPLGVWGMAKAIFLATLPYAALVAAVFAAFGK